MAPWMVAEIEEITAVCSFSLVLLRKQDEKYRDVLNKLAKEGVVILDKPYKGFSARRFLFGLFFLARHIEFLWGVKNAVFSYKSVIWFARIDISLFKSEKISIHSQFATQATIVGFLLKKYVGNSIEYSFTTHAHDIFFKNRWLPVLANESVCMITISEYNKKYIEDKYDLDINKVKVNYLGVNRSNLPESVKYVKRYVFGFISWMVEKKGLMNLLEAVRLLVEGGNNNFKLIVAGSGPLENKAKNFVCQHSITDYVDFIGAVYGDAKIDFYRSIDVLVMPSIDTGRDKDGIPVVLMEAVSYGLPLICSDVSGLPEICIHEFNGVLYSSNDVNKLAMGMNKFILSSDICLAYSINALIVSEKFDIIINTNSKMKSINWN